MTWFENHVIFDPRLCSASTDGFENPTSVGLEARAGTVGGLRDLQDLVGTWDISDVAPKGFFLPPKARLC